MDGRGQPPTTQNYPVEDVNSTKIGNLKITCIKVLSTTLGNVLLITISNSETQHALSCKTLSTHTHRCPGQLAGPTLRLQGILFSHPPLGCTKISPVPGK